MVFVDDWETCPECDSTNITGALHPPTSVVYMRCRDCGVKWSEIEEDAQLSFWDSDGEQTY